jgi:hypothetical protein
MVLGRRLSYRFVTIGNGIRINAKSETIATPGSLKFLVVNRCRLVKAATNSIPSAAESKSQSNGEKKCTSNE